MKKFKYRLAYKSNSIEERNSVFDELVSMGYQEQDIAGGLMVATHYRGNPYVISSFGENAYGERQLTQDKQTFLALAAMVDDNKFYKGEWVLATANCCPGRQVTIGNLYQVKSDVKDTDINILMSKFRKATKEEIIKHFEKRGSSSVIAKPSIASNPVHHPYIASEYCLPDKPLHQFCAEKCIQKQLEEPDYGFIQLLRDKLSGGRAGLTNDLVLLTNKKVKRYKLLVL